MPAESLHDPVVAGFGQIHGHLPIGAVQADLGAQHLPPGGVVADDPHDGQPEADRGVVLEAVKAKSPVAVDDQYLPVRERMLGGQGERHPHPEGAQRAGVHPAVRGPDRDHLGGLRDDVAPVADEDRVLVDEVADLRREAQRVHRALIGAELCLELGLQFVLPGPQFGCPVGKVDRGIRGAYLVEHPVEHHPQVPDHGHVCRPVLADQSGVYVELHDAGPVRDGAAEAEPEVQRGSGQQEYVAFPKGLPADPVKQLGAAVGHLAATHAVDKGRQRRLLSEALQGRTAPRPLDARAGHHHRTLGGGQSLHGGGHVGWVRVDHRRGGGDRRDGHIVKRRRAHKHIHRDLQERRSGYPGHGVAHRHLHVLGDPVGLVAGVGPLADRPDHSHVVHLLERPAAQIGERPLAADDQERTVGPPGVGDSSHPVGHPRAGGQHSAAQPTRVESAVGVGSVHSGLLVAHVDHRNALIEGPVKDRHHVTSGEGEDDPHPGLPEGPGHQPAAVGHLTGSTTVAACPDRPAYPRRPPRHGKGWLRALRPIETPRRLASPGPVP